MRELSLHILDIAENAIEAGARCIEIAIVEDLTADRLTITLSDDGRGMNRETLNRVRDPFFTTRSTRYVGLGIPLYAAAAERCAGELVIQSTEGRGTRITATFQHSHIDRAPLGDMCTTLMCILMRDPDLVLKYTHSIDKGSPKGTFELDTELIRRELDDIPLWHPDVREWLTEFIAEGERQLKEI